MPKLDLGYVRGPQGEPGYTPVKGVDYFDGKDGQNGKDGQDGYTPVKGVDYFDGKDGAQGPAGKDGSDYVLTEADKKEIAGMVEGSDVAVDGKTIIQNADGTISTAIGGYEVPGEEMFAWEGSLANEASATLSDISVFEDEFTSMDGDSITITYILDGEEYEEEYDITTDEKTEVVFENTKAELTAIVVNLTENTITVEHGGEALTSLVISTAAGYETINPNFVPVGRGLRRTASDIRLDDTYIEELIATYIEDNISNAEEASY